jgi:hypothetical protein
VIRDDDIRHAVYRIVRRIGTIATRPICLAVVLGVLPAALLVATASGGQGRGRNGAAVAVQLLAINDLHGHLEPPLGANGRIGDTPAGRAEYLATHLKNDIEYLSEAAAVASGMYKAGEAAQ